MPGEKTIWRKSRSRVWLAAVIGSVILAAAWTEVKEVVLIGPQTKEKILQAVPEWKQQMAVYAPKLDVVDKLHSLPQPVHIRVFLATWCPDCKKHVSAFFRVMEMVDNPSISVELIGVSKDKKEPAALVQENHIERVPTFIVVMNGEEKGRVIEIPRVSIEEDLAAIILEALNEQPSLELDLEYFRTHPHADLPVDCTKCHLPTRRK